MWDWYLFKFEEEQSYRIICFYLDMKIHWLETDVSNKNWCQVLRLLFVTQKGGTTCKCEKSWIIVLISWEKMCRTQLKMAQPCTMWMHVVPLNHTLKNGYNGKFYVTYILLQLTKPHTKEMGPKSTNDFIRTQRPLSRRIATWTQPPGPCVWNTKSAISHHHL